MENGYRGNGGILEDQGIIWKMDMVEKTELRRNWSRCSVKPNTGNTWPVTGDTFSKVVFRRYSNYCSIADLIPLGQWIQAMELGSTV